MSDQLWKRVERDIAAFLGGERVPVTGRQRGSAPDVSHHHFAIEVKHRQTLPKWLMTRIKEVMKIKDSFTAFRWDIPLIGTFFVTTLERLHEATETPYIIGETVARNAPDWITEAIEQAYLSGKETLQKKRAKVQFPVVFLHQKQMKVKDSIVLIRENDLSDLMAHLNGL